MVQKALLHRKLQTPFVHLSIISFWHWLVEYQQPLRIYLCNQQGDNIECYLLDSSINFGTMPCPIPVL